MTDNVYPITIAVCEPSITDDAADVISYLLENNRDGAIEYIAEHPDPEALALELAEEAVRVEIAAYERLAALKGAIEQQLADISDTFDRYIEGGGDATL